MDAVDRGGDLYLEGVTSAEVLSYLAQYLPENGGDGRFARMLGPGTFSVDRTTWREAQQMAGERTHEAGMPDQHYETRQRAGMDLSAREF